MKAAFIFLATMLSWATTFGQGLVNFANDPSTLVTTAWVSSPPTSTYFGLLSAPQGTLDPLQFTFSGVYGTNVAAAAGRFTGGIQTVNGWAAGQTRSFLVAGWPSSLGHDFNPDWLVAYHGGPPWFPDAFGISSIGTGVAGGFDGTFSWPTLHIFGAAPAITSGFTLVLIPEPASAGLAMLGVFVMLWSRKRSSCNGVRI